MNSQQLIPKHGGYRKLRTFQIARLIFDITIRFCDKFVSRYSRTHDQMVQAARSGVQNIAEGSQASGTSKKTEMKLTNVARASLEELRLDYEDFLRQHTLSRWESRDPRRQHLIDQKIASCDAFAKWARDIALQSQCQISETAANGVLVLLNVSCVLLDRQIAAQAKAFQEEGGFTERLYKVRSSCRQNKNGR
jgi:four helix bundle suffix protein